MARKHFIIVGNWKMNPPTLEEARALFSLLNRRAKEAKNVTVVAAMPAPFVGDIARKASIAHVSAQDVAENAGGAFTGSYSASQALAAGAEYSIIGHSERRKAGDTDAIVAKKTRLALDAGLKVILCVGETERDEHARYLQTIREQVMAVAATLDKKTAAKQIKSLIIAYEPVWAIGKSYDAALKPSGIHEMSIYIRKTAAEIFGKKDGLKIPVLYGGSVDLENAKAILKEGAADGLLVGRQSLDPKAFGGMIEYADTL